MNLKSKKYLPYKGKVYDLTVEKTHSYNVEALGVHNSGAGSLVNFLLGITYVDPVKDKLIFARFMSLARAKNDLPDVDLDWSDRDHAVKLLKKEFGDEKVIPITNFNALQMKSLVKDVSKLHSVPFEESNNATKNLDYEVKPHLQTGDETKGAVELTYDACREFSTSFSTFMDKYPAVDHDVKILGKQLKALGKHAGGIVVLDDPASVMPLISVRGELQSPWSEGMNMKGLSPYGIQKMDFLALKTLRIFESCIRRILKRHLKIRNPTFDQVREYYETKLSPANIDTADPKVFDHVFRGNRFAGVFQFTNPSTQKFMRELDPRNVDDIAAATAIYRPGPLAAHVDKEYVRARNENSYKSYGHPIVDETLRDTRGFVVYQEQIQQVAMNLAGFSEDDADRLRKAILKRTTKDVGKAKSVTEELHDKFIAGAVANGYSENKAETLYEDMRAFAAYGFVKAHAYSYAYVTYQCAWLMTYYEPEWLCSYAETMLADPDSRRRALAEIKAMGYDVAKVDINKSGKEWEISDDGKTFYPSFLTVKGVGLTAIDEIIIKRPYRKLEDLFWNNDGSWRHSKFNAKAMDALLRVGALDSMKLVGPDRQFETYRQLHHVLLDGQADLKKRLKTDPERHIRRLNELIEESKQLPDWNRGEIVKSHVELFGSIESDVLLSENVRTQLKQFDIPPIEDCQNKGTHWFVLSDVKKKTTRTGRNYFMLSVFGSDGSSYRVFVWNSGNSDPSMLRKYACYIAQLRKDKMGISTSLKDMREVEG
jgi:DNA polymerase-3 subunit alpha